MPVIATHYQNWAKVMFGLEVLTVVQYPQEMSMYSKVVEVLLLMSTYPLEMSMYSKVVVVLLLYNIHKRCQCTVHV